MNGYERIKAALSGRWPDKVPVMLHNFLVASREAGFTQREYRDDYRNIAESYIRAVEKYRYDGILVDVDTAVLAGALGVPVTFPEDESARSHGTILSSLEAVENLPEPDILGYRYIDNWLKAVRLLAEHFKGEIYVRGNCDQAPFSLASMVRGVENWMMDLCDEESAGYVKRLLDICTKASLQFVEAMAQTGADMISNGDSPAGPSMIAPGMYRDFALPCEKAIIAKVHEMGKPYTLHICGDTTPILEGMVESGADAIELDYKTDIRRVHELCRDSVTFIGNIDPSGIIAMGTPAMVREAASELLGVYADSPRFILNAGCAIPAITPEENLFELVRAAREFR